MGAGAFGGVRCGHGWGFRTDRRLAGGCAQRAAPAPAPAPDSRERARAFLEGCGAGIRSGG